MAALPVVQAFAWTSASTCRCNYSSGCCCKDANLLKSRAHWRAWNGTPARVWRRVLRCRHVVVAVVRHACNKREHNQCQTASVFLSTAARSHTLLSKKRNGFARGAFLANRHERRRRELRAWRDTSRSDDLVKLTALLTPTTAAAAKKKRKYKRPIGTMRNFTLSISAALNDPRQPRASDIFTEDWGSDFGSSLVRLCS